MSIEFFGEDEDFYNPYGSDEDEDEGGKTRGIESKSKPKATGGLFSCCMGKKKSTPASVEEEKEEYDEEEEEEEEEE